MSRLWIVLFSLTVALTGLTMVSASSSATPSAPTSLNQIAGSQPVIAGRWTNHNQLQLSFQESGTGIALTPQVEVRRWSTPFTNSPNYQGASTTVPSGSSATLTVQVSGLKNGLSYAWQARVSDGQGNYSAWVPFGVSGSAAFRIDTKKPSPPHITSPTNPRWGAWYRTKIETFSWASTDGSSGIAGYSFAVGHNTHSPRPPMGTSTSTTFSNLGNGKWVLHVWSRDKAGNWSKLGYYRFNINRQAPKATLFGISRSYYNPYDGKETWRFNLNHWASVKVAVARTGLHGSVVQRNLGTLKPGQHDFVWNGREAHNHIAHKGWYWIRIFTSDKLGNHAVYAFGGIHVKPWKARDPFVYEPGRHIVVSLSKQELYAYNGHKLVMHTLVTTGNPALPTPTGHFTIFAKFHPFQFISPWPPGSPYYYAPSWTNYAMEFQNQGYFIHDAPWRSVYGPGSNGPGQPGTNYGGSHGCVNVPFKPAKWLYYWAPMGTSVDIVK